MLIKSNTASLFAYYNVLLIVIGRSWEEKIKKVREKMTEKKADAVVVSALDEIACKKITKLGPVVQN